MESGCEISYFSHKFPTPATRTLSVRISYAAFYWGHEHPDDWQHEYLDESPFTQYRLEL